MIEGRHFEMALVFSLTQNYCSLRADDDSSNAKDVFNVTLLPDTYRTWYYCKDYWSDPLSNSNLWRNEFDSNTSGD